MPLAGSPDNVRHDNCFTAQRAVRTTFLNHLSPRPPARLAPAFKLMIHRLIAILFLGISAQAPAEPIQIEGLSAPVELSLPSNYEAGKSYPAVFFYHGTGGHPTTTMIRSQAGPKDWIVVGMSYIKPGTFTFTPENVKAEVAMMHKVRDLLVKTKGLDPKRLYISGFSLGGWMADMMFQDDRSLAGAVILAAGHMYEVSEKPAAYRPDTPLFLGVGRLDGNYPFSLKAKLYYGKLGVTARMETWDKQEHSFPQAGSPGLKEWFTLRNGGSADETALEAENGEIGKLPPLDQWRALLEFRERPFVNVPGSKWPDRIKARIAELEKTPDVAPEAKAFLRHRQLIAEEINAKTLPDLAKVQKGYEALVPEAGNGEEVDLIVQDLKRVTGLVERFEQQKAEREAQRPQPQPVEPNMPKSDRGIPRNPLIK